MRDWLSYLTQLTDEKIKNYTEQGYWANKRLCEYLDEAAALYPNKIAIVDRFGQYSYKQFSKWVDNLAMGFIANGVERGDVISFQLPNWKEVLIITYACTKIGAVFNAIAPIFRERDIGKMLELAGSKFMIVPYSFRNFSHMEMMQSLQLPCLEKVFIVKTDMSQTIPENMISFNEFLEFPWSEKVDENTALQIKVDPNHVTQVAFTSGTTGEPKGILHTHNTLLDTCQSWIERFNLTENDVFHMASTLGHQTGFLYGTEMPIIAKGKIVLQDIWDPTQFVQLIEREKITMSNGAIPFLDDMLHVPNLGDYDLSSLRLFGCFGAGLPRPLARLAYDKLPNVTLFGGWGMTETSLPVTNLPNDPIDKVCETDGIPVRGSEVRVMNNYYTEFLPPGMEGEIVTRGPMRHLGFLQPHLSNELFIEGDWYKTGDRGIIREDGNLVMTTRSKDIIVRGGENIPVLEIENLLLEHPKVNMAAVVAVPDERLGEKACACVVPHGNQEFTFQDLLSWMVEHKLTKQYWPELLEVFTEFPTTPSGKIQKFNLREHLKKKASNGVN